ncbi:ATP-dependent nuclease [Tunturiibacter lichenicola]|uniref:ATP-dependent nuclease n=1 Tax=Tunturiibacter lichenicola TaxID=2051959 RepID=UPI0021B2397D|nr:ATP-binding protein [Edaphobacter lichenicola]
MFERLLITEMMLGSGRSSSSNAQRVELSSLTVFVGPNNSGKSMALNEIYRWTQFQRSPHRLIVKEIKLTPLTQEEAEYTISVYARKPGPEESNVPRGNLLFLKRGGQDSNTREGFLNILTNPDRQLLQFGTLYLNNVTLNLGIENRAQITQPKPFGDLRNPDPLNTLQNLFLDDFLKKRVQNILLRAFKKYFVIDPSSGQFRISFADQPPENPDDEKGLHATALDYYKKAQSIETLSGGVKAYTGIIVEVFAGNTRVVLIDEPEAFLHPPLAQELGSEIASLADEKKKSVFVATHSAHFVMGCLQSAASVDIVRLTYQNGVATSRVLKNADLMKMMRDPLLRSTGVINALFYEFVVVTESDSDRAFYQEINQRLVKEGAVRGIPNCLFLNAQNKQTTRRIVKPLRELGIPTISIVDIDILKEGGKIWSNYLESGFIPAIDRQTFATTREALHSYCKKNGLELKSSGGIEAFDQFEKESARNLLNRLAEYGLFVVQNGELESWLKDLNVTSHKSDWLVDMFEKLGEDYSTSHYVKPGINDVWAFITAIRGWFSDTERRGMPE